MAQTLPVPAGQPPEATRKAAGQVVTLAGAQVVAVQAAASITLAALLWPLIPAARAVAGLASALGQRLPLCPLPEQQVVVVMPGSGGAGRAATVPGGRPGTVRAACAITLGVEEEFVLLDPSTGATVLACRSGADARRGAGDPAGADAVPGRDRHQGVHRPGRPRTRAGPAPAARRGRRGISGLLPGGLRGRAVPHARAGRRDRPAPLPGAGTPVRPGGGRCRHLRLPRARRGPLPGPGRPGPGAAAALAGAAARRHRQLPDRRRGTIPDGPAGGM